MRHMIRNLIAAAAFLAAVPAVGRNAEAASLPDVMNAHKDEIITMCREYGIWPSVVVGMAGVETGVSSLSQLGEVYNNYWGHTYSSLIAAQIPGTGTVFGPFAAYPTFSDGLKAHLMWFWQNGYGGVQGVLRNLNSSKYDAYSAIISSGYMEGTAGYYEGIIAAAHAVGADEWDDLAFPDGRKYIPYIEGLPCSVEVGSYDYPRDEYNTRQPYEDVLPEIQTPVKNQAVIDRVIAEPESGTSYTKEETDVWLGPMCSWKEGTKASSELYPDLDTEEQ